MKQITFILLLIGFAGIAQVKGNKTIETRTFTIDNVDTIKINFYAKVTIDQSAKEGMTITTDSNLFDLIDKEVVGGTLHLDQLEWIQPSQKAVITIGAPNIRHVESGTHDLTRIINVNNDYLQVIAPVGEIIIKGKTKELSLGAKLATIDASKIEALNAYVNLWNWGTIKVNAINYLWADVSNSGKLIYDKEPKLKKVTTKNDGVVISKSDIETLRNDEAEWIRFKIKNNSFNRNHFVVVGPKPDGSKFSYGFPMMPQSTRKEHWTVGTKIYRKNSLGFKKLLVTITKDNANTVVKLFN
jgi:hypothetical protein